MKLFFFYLELINYSSLCKQNKEVTAVLKTSLLSSSVPEAFLLLFCAKDFGNWEVFPTSKDFSNSL
jgi:hypothetical protein